MDDTPQDYSVSVSTIYNGGIFDLPAKRGSSLQTSHRRNQMDCSYLLVLLITSTLNYSRAPLSMRKHTKRSLTRRGVIYRRGSYRAPRSPGHKACTEDKVQDSKSENARHCFPFRCVRKIAKSDYQLPHVCLSECLHTWNNSDPNGRIFMKFILQYVFKICRENLCSIKIWQE